MSALNFVSVHLNHNPPKPAYMSHFCGVYGLSSYELCSQPFLHRQEMFALLEFTIGTVVDGGEGLIPSELDLASPLAKVSREKLLRAWVELNVWVNEYTRRNGELGTMDILHRRQVLTLVYPDAKLRDRKMKQAISGKAESATEHVQTELGAHPSQSRLTYFVQILQGSALTRLA
jgi:hypothetical protein